LSGKTKASIVDKPENTMPALPTTGPETSATSDRAERNPGATAPNSTDPSADTQGAYDNAAKVPPSTRTNQPPATNPNASNVADRSQSVLEGQNANAGAQKPEPNWSETDSVETLWGAVQAGSVSAEVSLAERFARGAGVSKNCDQAKVLMKAAANKGNREARLRLYELETNGCQ